jgi:hypothetical protein
MNRRLAKNQEIASPRNFSLQFTGAPGYDGALDNGILRMLLTQTSLCISVLISAHYSRAYRESNKFVLLTSNVTHL